MTRTNTRTCFLKRKGYEYQANKYVYRHRHKSLNTLLWKNNTNRYLNIFVEKEKGRNIEQTNIGTVFGTIIRIFVTLCFWVLDSINLFGV